MQSYFTALLIVTTICMFFMCHREDQKIIYLINDPSTHDQTYEALQYLSLDKTDQLILKQVIQQAVLKTHKKERMTESKVKKMKTSLKEGLIKGSLMGLVSAGPAGAVASGITMGSMSAISSGLRSTYNFNNKLVDLEDVDDKIP